MKTVIDEKNGGRNSKNKKMKEIDKKLLRFSINKIFFQTSFALFLFLNLAFIFIVSFFFWKVLKTISIFGETIVRLHRYQNNFLDLFNRYREFLFDEGSIIDGEKGFNYVMNQEYYIYETILEDNTFLYYHLKDIPHLLDNYGPFASHTLCSRRIKEYEFFVKEEDCINTMSKSTLNGFDVFSMYFVEEIHTKRNYLRYKLNQKIMIGNLTRYGYENLTDFEGKEYRLNIFNDYDAHGKFNAMFIHAMWPYVLELRKLFYGLIMIAVDGKEKTYVAIMAVYLVTIFLLFFTIWIPMVNQINNDISQAKKTLTIIPEIILNSSNLKIS